MKFKFDNKMKFYVGIIAIAILLSVVYVSSTGFFIGRTKYTTGAKTTGYCPGTPTLRIDPSRVRPSRTDIGAYVTGVPNCNNQSFKVVSLNASVTGCNGQYSSVSGGVCGIQAPSKVGTYLYYAFVTDGPMSKNVALYVSSCYTAGEQCSASKACCTGLKCCNGYCGPIGACIV